MSENWLFDVTDLKQYACCPRLIYYRLCWPDIRPLTFTMQTGIQSHHLEDARENRRSLQLYGLAQGERLFHYALTSEKLGLKGKVDMVIISPSLQARDRQLFLVEYKDSEQQIGLHFKLQLAAYALLLEETFRLPVQRAFLYSIPRRQAEAVSITQALRKKVTTTLQQMQHMLLSEQMPEQTPAYRRCPTCEFRRFCNDVV